MAASETDLSRRNGHIDTSHFILPPFPIVDVRMSDLLSPEGRLAPQFQEILTKRLTALNRLPQDKKLHFKNPPGRHSESEAHYVLEYSTGDWEIYAYVLPPNKRTSVHHHPKSVSEEYELIAGRFTLLLNDEVVDVARYVELGSFVDHQGITGARPALVLAMTYNPEHVSPADLHIKSVRNWTEDWRRHRITIIRNFEAPNTA